MSNAFPERVHIDGQDYELTGYPLEGFLKNWPDWPRFPAWPCNAVGYTASWIVANGHFCLADLRCPVQAPLVVLFPGVPAPVPASWVDGLLKATRGERRHVSYPSRLIYEDEVYLEVRGGAILREWRLDLRGVPDQTDDELRLSLPRFLWPARLREAEPDEGAGGAG
ncbi:hypothetical protein G4G28_13875 [Massilia sp. Dwa41.01b]|uniref:hypothetical protein n=1 Tax=Massilia sp. Dwa41.01b TaxID=2709302 RepID=UPI0015FF9751|nr:hypothetical protein [Massilia sp. Dwa41.01b]QNA89281.1 hypothetical protein G4G28_13875 [Massilia sp. Dwa41.01b]